MTAQKTGPSERDLQRALALYLQALHIWTVRMNSGALRDKTGRPVRFGCRGMADLLALPWLLFNDSVNPDLELIRCRPLWLECKSRTGRQTQDQRAFQQSVESYGHIYLLVRSLDEVIEWVSKNRAQARP